MRFKLIFTGDMLPYKQTLLIEAPSEDAARKCFLRQAPRAQIHSVEPFEGGRYAVYARCDETGQLV